MSPRTQLWKLLSTPNFQTNAQTTNRQKTANKIVTKIIFSDVSSQDGNALFLKEKMIKEKAGHCWPALTHSFTTDDAIR